MRNSVLFQKIDRYSISREAKEQGIYPYFRSLSSSQGPEITLSDGRRLVMFGSNDYLGLASHPEVKDAGIRALKAYGSGCAGSRFLNGTLELHERLEAALADWLGKEAAVVFATGFQTSQGVINSVVNRRDHLFMDSQDHASLVDGARISGAKLHRYAHNDLDQLEKALVGTSPGEGKLIVVDGVFSMEGDVVRLPGVVALAETHRAALMLDDAHGLGVLGPDGRGTAARFNLVEHVDFLMGTFSKSLASVGGFVAADAQSIEFLRHHARSLIFSASQPAASVAAALAALGILRREPERIRRLWKNTELLRQGLRSLGFDTGRSETPIIPVYVGDIPLLAKMCRRLEEEAVFVNPVIPPAVPPDRCLLRLSVMATHQASQIAWALEKFARVGRELGVIGPKRDPQNIE